MQSVKLIGDISVLLTSLHTLEDSDIPAATTIFPQPEHDTKNPGPSQA
jgi:hypothetical protein